MKHIKRISFIVVAVLVLACSVPLSSLAVDPVSASTMANALAQAITAYGASLGVSMTFDVANTDSIGEGVHELWNQYQADMANSSVTVSDYQNLAASAFPTLWIKIGEKIGVNLDAASVGEIDGFWNWLLSGPAEMTKVDNQYYEWTVNQSGSVDPITVIYDRSFPLIPNYDYSNLSDIDRFNSGLLSYSSTGNEYSISCNKNGTYIVFILSEMKWYVINKDYPFQYIGVRHQISNEQYTTNVSGIVDTSSDGYYKGAFQFFSIIQSQIPNVTVPKYDTLSDAINAINGDINNPSYDYLLSVMPYIGDAVPQNVYIPDNTDVNYEPIPASIPTDISWDDTLFGDGTGTLTDAQSEAVTQAVDQAIADNPAKTIELADIANPPAPSPSEVYIPFLPVTLPSFQFSLSGIWHYVTAWVASLGAWFSLVFTTWSYLPYAISVPVYATAVIVIVLGVYKRFFM